MLNGRFTKPIFSAAEGDFVGPVRSEFGWHIAEVLDRRAATQPSFETLRPKIANFMTFDAIQDLMTELRSGAEVEILDDVALAPETNSEDVTDETTEND